MSTKNISSPGLGEHAIVYAYPGSPSAKAVGRDREGAYCVKAGKKITGYASYAEAVEAAKALGTTPWRWSMDHPLNAKFLQPGEVNP